MSVADDLADILVTATRRQSDLAAAVASEEPECQEFIRDLIARLQTEPRLRPRGSAPQQSQPGVGGSVA